MKLNKLINEMGDLISRFDLIKVIAALQDKDISYYLINDPDVNDETIINIKKHIEDDYPIAYIKNEMYFYNNYFYVDERVLIPRVETEDLVKYAINFIKKYNLKKVVDIGTGSGVIAITLKKELPNLEVIATDISEEALKVAKFNAKNHEVEIEFMSGDSIEAILNIDNIDFIISNPPYVEDNFKNESLRYEPTNALYAGEDGQDFFRNLLKYKNYLMNKKILVETTEFNYFKTEIILKNFGNTKVLTDCFNINRFIGVNV